MTTVLMLCWVMVLAVVGFMPVGLVQIHLLPHLLTLVKTRGEWHQKSFHCDNP